MKRFSRPVSWILLCALMWVAVPAMAKDGDAARHFTLGKTAFQAQHYRQAASEFERARRAGMKGPAVSYNLGVSYFRLRDYPRAAQAFRETARYRSMRALAHYNLGLVSLRQGDKAQAQVWFQSAFDETQDAKLKALAASQLNGLVRTRRAANATSDRWLALVSADLGYDSNVTLANNALAGASGQNDFYAELFAYAQGVLSGESDNGVLVKASAYRLEYNTQGAFNMTVLNAGLYKAFPLGAWHSEAGVYLGDATLAGNDYLRNYSAIFDTRRRFNKGPLLRLRLRYHNYTAQNPTYDYLSGNSEDARVEGRWSWSGKRRLMAYYQLDMNNRNNLRRGSTFSSFSPTRHTVHVSYTRPIAPRWTLEGQLDYRTSRYSDDYVLTSGARVQRDDKRTRAGVELTHALSNKADLVFDYHYTRNSSSLSVYSYTRSVITAGVQYLF